MMPNQYAFPLFQFVHLDKTHSENEYYLDVALNGSKRFRRTNKPNLSDIEEIGCAAFWFK
jgi:hypothetical protein